MTDARVSREVLEVLASGTPAAQVSREVLEVLEVSRPDARLSRIAVEALYSSPSTAGTFSWFDGTTRQPVTVRGWWDGAAIQPLKAPYVYFTPAAISGLGLWLDAAQDSAGRTDGSPVNIWHDSSPAARHAVSNYAAPTYRMAGVNGRPAIEFVGGNAQFIVPGWGTALSGSSQYTMFQVVQQRSSYGNYPTMTTAPTSSTWQWITEFDSGAGVYFGSGNGRYRMFNAGVPLNETQLFSFLQPAGSGPRFFRNSVEVTSYGLGPNGDSAAVVPNLGPDVAVGSYYDGQYGMNGYICAVLWYDHALTDTERGQVEGYLRTAYAIA